MDAPVRAGWRRRCVEGFVAALIGCGGGGSGHPYDLAGAEDGPADSPEWGDFADATDRESPPDADVDVETDAGWSRPCVLGSDCPTGVCVETSRGQSFCADACLDTPCPPDWRCTLVRLAGDPIWLCLPQATYLCRPCRAHEDCAPAGLWTKNYCVERQDRTSFCAQDCSSGIGCPPGYDCVEVEVPGVGQARQCVPQGGECTCIEEFVKAGYEAACRIENEWGRCAGSRRCSADGLTPCTARVPAREICNGLDDDCDGLTDEEDAQGCTVYFADADGDRFGAEAAPRCLCAPEGLFRAIQAGDCDDADPDRSPGVPERCADRKDNDCDGLTDEEAAIGCRTFFADEDLDGHGDAARAACLCEAAAPFTAGTADDCDDTDGTVFPGALERCNGRDDDCDGQTDEEGAEGCGILFWDSDQDGFGVTGDSRCLCAPFAAYRAAAGGDCDDLDQAVNPDAGEVCNTRDDDCDGLVDEEGAGGCVPYFFDADGDAFGVQGVAKCLCGPKGPYSTLAAGDCNDGNPQVNPAAPEVCGNGLDDDCDGSQNDEGAVGCAWFFRDADGDGYGVAGDSRCLCFADGAYRAGTGGDCDDADPAVHPGAKEDCATEGDDNCNGETNEQNATGCTPFWADRDLDGWGSDETECWCEPAGVFTATRTGDCEDGSAAIHPGAAEVCNARDDDCDGATDDAEDLPGCKTFYLDADADGYGTAATKCLCAAAGPYRSEKTGDCNDANPNVFPGAPEVCDGADNDCDGATDEGADRFPNAWPGPLGPDPFDPWRYPDRSFATIQETLTPSGDVDFFSVEATEANFTQCRALNCKVTLSGIPPGQDYRLCACWSDLTECDLNGGNWTCSDAPGNATETVTVVLPENQPPAYPCIGNGGNSIVDHGYCDIRVARVSGAATCEPYELNWIVWE